MNKLSIEVLSVGGECRFRYWVPGYWGFLSLEILSIGDKEMNDGVSGMRGIGIVEGREEEKKKNRKSNSTIFYSQYTFT